MKMVAIGKTDTGGYLHFFFFLQLPQKSSRAEPVNSQGSAPFEPAGITLTKVNPENLFAQPSA